MPENIHSGGLRLSQVLPDVLLCVSRGPRQGELRVNVPRNCDDIVLLRPGQFVLGATTDVASASFSIAFLVALLVLLSLTIMVALHTILAEE